VASLAGWNVGTLTVGQTVVTELDSPPVAVFFWGTNWLTEDAAVTTTARGLFRGMAAPKYDAPGTIVQGYASIVIPGDAHRASDTEAIGCVDTSGLSTVLYAAALTAFIDDGFTLSWSATGGGGKVVYAALLDVEHVGAFTSLSATVTLGWKAGACLLHGAWAGPAINGDDRTQEFYGGAAYPGTSHLGWQGAGMTAYCFPTSANAQYVMALENQAPTTIIAADGNFPGGPFLSPQNVQAFPVEAATITQFTLNTNLGDTPAMVVAWDDEDSRTGRLTPATSEGGTVTVTGLPFAPALVIFYTLSDEPPILGSNAGGATGGRSGAGFGVVADDFQWCATADGIASRGAFQSFQRGLATVVNGSSVHATTVALTDDGFVMTTQEDDVAPASIIWHAFGHPKPELPVIYRHGVRYRG
jgi:hypothetical protein